MPRKPAADPQTKPPMQPVTYASLINYKGKTFRYVKDEKVDGEHYVYFERNDEEEPIQPFYVVVGTPGTASKLIFDEWSKLKKRLATAKAKKARREARLPPVRASTSNTQVLVPTDAVAASVGCCLSKWTDTS